MDNRYIVKALELLKRKDDKLPIHVRIPGDELDDGSVLLLCDTSDNAFFNSKNHWIQFYVRIYPSDFLLTVQNIDNESGVAKIIRKGNSDPETIIGLRIAYRIVCERNRIIGK